MRDPIHLMLHPEQRYARMPITSERSKEETMRRLHNKIRAHAGLPPLPKRVAWKRDVFVPWVGLVVFLATSCALSPETRDSLRRAGDALSGGIQCDRDEQCAAGETCREGWCV